jgi:nucleotide-binding universal stress UspA family protein
MNPARENITFVRDQILAFQASRVDEDRYAVATQAPTAEPVRRILVATDFSAAADHATEWAVALAVERGADVALLHVIDINTQLEPSASDAAEGPMERLWGEATARIKRRASSLGSAIKVRTILAEGLPWEEIVEQSRHFDVVILGRDSCKRPARFFSRHTSERVIANARCPVIVAADPNSKTAWTVKRTPAHAAHSSTVMANIRTESSHTS